MKIKNIVFDFGGVLLNLDYSLTYDTMSSIMGMDLTTNHIPPTILKILMAYEKGEINTETFLWNLQRASFHPIIQVHQLIKSWNAMLLGWNPDRFDFLDDLKSKYHLYLLSNTNELHLDWVVKDLEKNHQITDFNDRFFRQTFYSHLIGMRKPDRNIYAYVNDSEGLNPSETLFIDDNSDNVSAAIQFGWNAQIHDPKKEIIEMLPSYIEEIEA